MNHSILDGAPSRVFADPGTARAFGRAPVREHMSRPAVAVTPDTDFATMVAAVTASRRGVLPVVGDDDAVLGVVSASDLLAAYADERPGEITARTLMTSPAITVTEDQSVGDALRTARREAIHHIPVVDSGGRLTGVLSPYDLLDSLRRDDEAVRDQALALALTPGSGAVPGSLHIRCERGHVLLTGRTRTRTDAAALCMRVGAIDGLAGLTGRLRWDLDDAQGGGTDSAHQPVATAQDQP